MLSARNPRMGMDIIGIRRRGMRAGTRAGGEETLMTKMRVVRTIWRADMGGMVDIGNGALGLELGGGEGMIRGGMRRVRRLKVVRLCGRGEEKGVN
jgi:hypothetical protein